MVTLRGLVTRPLDQYYCCPLPNAYCCPGNRCCDNEHAVCCPGSLKCCSTQYPVCCPDNDICCPTAYPVCKNGRCYNSTGDASSEGMLGSNSKWMMHWACVLSLSDWPRGFHWPPTYFLDHGSMQRINEPHIKYYYSLTVVALVEDRIFTVILSVKAVRREKLFCRRELAWDRHFQLAGVRVGRCTMPWGHWICNQTFAREWFGGLDTGWRTFWGPEGSSAWFRGWFTHQQVSEVIAVARSAQ